MTDKSRDLDSLLRSLKIPASNQAKQKTAFFKARDALLEEPVPNRPYRIFIFVPLLTAAILLVMVKLSSNPPHLIASDSVNIARNEAILRQMLIVFPTGLAAIENKNGASRLIFNDDESLPSADPVLVVLKKGQYQTEIVSFSGQKVRTKVGGEDENLEFYRTGKGGVVVVGQNFVWSSDDSSKNQGRALPFTIEARALGI